MDQTGNLLTTPLHSHHCQLGAKMVPFGGWDMPVQYDGILQEYDYTRKASALFDISHMGEFEIIGDPVETGLDRIVTMNIVDMPVNTSKYGMILDENGGIIDDLIVFRLENDKWFLVVNAATTPKDKDHFIQNLKNPDCFNDVSSQIGKLDLQGPGSRDVLKKFVPDIEKLKYFAFDFFELLGQNVLISRTGYTGELGYEIFYPWDKTAQLWETLLNVENVRPAGLGARDILRLEVGYSLYGHELSEETSPIEAGLSRFVHFDKEFIGKDAVLSLKEKGAARKIVGLISDNRRAPREGQHIYINEETVGVVTSGTFSPHLQKGIGLAYVDKNKTELGAKIEFGNDKVKASATLSARTFYDQGSLKD